MIDLVHMNGEVFIWNAEDWMSLRDEHRIVGNLVGTLACLPRQDKLLGLPLCLMQEEVRLLLDQKIARVVKYDILTTPPSDDIKEKFEDFRQHNYQEQVEYFQSERKKQITSMVDIIVDGKRRKLMGLSTKKQKGKKKKYKDTEPGSSESMHIEIPDRDAIIKQEFDKIVPITQEMALIQTPTECPYLTPSDKEIVNFVFPETPEETLRSRVFSDLWSRGFFITAGHKFGGNFLVYPGDPIKFHAQFIVICREADQPFRAAELVSMCRLGTSVRKSIVLATLSQQEGEEEIVYHTLQWTP